MRSLFWLGLLFPLLAFGQTSARKTVRQTSPAKSPSPRSPLPTFKDVAKEAGLTVSHISTPEKKYIVESMSGGAGLIDCDGDGLLDIITVNGSSVDRYRQGGRKCDRAHCSQVFHGVLALIILDDGPVAYIYWPPPPEPPSPLPNADTCDCHCSPNARISTC